MRLPTVIGAAVTIVAVTVLGLWLEGNTASARRICPAGQTCVPIPTPTPPSDPDQPPASYPLEFAITGIREASIFYKWRDNAQSEDGFRIYRTGPESDDPQTFWVASRDTPGKGERYNRTDADLSGGRYCYWITAVNEYGESPATPERCVTVTGPPPAPPTDLAITETETDSISVQWRDNSTNESGFTVERRWRRDEQWEDVYSVKVRIHEGAENNPGRLYTRTDADVSAGTGYCYRAIASNAGGEAVTGEVCDRTLLSAPYAVKLTPGRANSMNVQWTESNTREDGYNIFRRRPGGEWERTRGYYASNCDSLGCESTHDFWQYGLEPDTTYCYRITADYNGEESAPSAEECATTLLPQPNAVGDFMVVDATQTSVTLRWRDYADDDQRNVLIRTHVENDTEEQVMEWGSMDGVTTYTDQRLSPGTAYEYVVETHNANNYARSQTVAVETEEMPSTAELVFNGSLTLTPFDPEPYENFTLTWVACNAGNEAAGDFTDAAQLNGDQVFERSVENVLPGRCYEKNVEHSGLPAGDHEWRVYLDAYADVDESREDNNASRYGFQIHE